jgi:hypothetical protein
MLPIFFNGTSEMLTPFIFNFGLLKSSNSETQELVFETKTFYYISGIYLLSMNSLSIKLGVCIFIVFIYVNAFAQVTSRATLENVNVIAETPLFLYYQEAIKINSTIFDHTQIGGSNYSARLNGSSNERFGLAKSLAVNPNDTIKIEVYAKYLDPNSQNWTTALSNFINSIINATAPLGTFIDGGAMGSTGGVTPSFSTVLNKNSETGAAPKAYLNYLIFDKNFTFLNGGFIRLTTASREYGQNGLHEKLAVKLPISQPGYVYAYLSNDNVVLGGSPIEVYFDDLTITQTFGHNILTENDQPIATETNQYFITEN